MIMSDDGDDDAARRAPRSGMGEDAVDGIAPRCDRIRDMAVDMSPYRDDDLRFASSAGGTTPVDGNGRRRWRKRRRECRIELREALCRDGFALVRGFPDIDGATCADALRAARSFLHEADESVRRSCLTKDRARRGYSPSSSENFASLIGQVGPNDLVRKFRIGPIDDDAVPASTSSCDANDHEDVTPSHRASASSSLHRPNVWPTANAWDDGRASKFKSSIEEYFVLTCRAADCILRAICDGMIDDNDHNDEDDDDEDDNDDDDDERYGRSKLL